MTAPAFATSAAFVVVEQLNQAQWHAIDPWGGASGVDDYVGAVADALWMAAGFGLGVETIALNGDRMTLQWPGVES